MKYLLAALFLANLLFSTGCEKKKNNPGNDCLAKLDFTKITSTDEIGNQISVDPTDWTNEVAWCEQEYSLFSTTGLDLEGSDTSALFTLLFPNPLNRVGVMVLIRPKLCPFHCAIVNRSFQVLDTFSIPNKTGNMLVQRDFSDSLKYRPGEYYRIYFAAHSTAKMFFFKGHGDFYISPSSGNF